MSKLTDAQRAFLNDVRYATLATINDDGTPQQTVMWYLLDGDQILMNTLRGRKKDRNILRDARASLCVENGEQYLTIAGRITIDDARERGQRLKEQLAIRYEGPERAAELMRDVYSKQDRISLIMTVDKVDAYGFGTK